MTYEIWIETLQAIRNGSNAALVHWGTDDSWKYEQSTRFIASYFDLNVTTYSSALEKASVDGFDNFILSQWAASSLDMNHPLKAAECQYQVSFIGTAYGDRKKWVDSIKAGGIDRFRHGH